MFLKRIFPIAALACLFAGCSVISNARKAQKDVALKSGENSVSVTNAVRLVDLSLESLVAFAMSNRPCVVSARLAVEDARLALKQLAADAPVISSTPWTAAKVNVGVSHAESSKRKGDLDDLRFSTDGSMSGSISLGLLVYDFGRYGAAASAAAEEVILAEKSLVDVGFSVFEEVSATYFSLHEKAALLEVAYTNEFEYSEHLKRAEDSLAVGEGKKLDVTRAKLDLSRAKEQTIAASNAVVTTGAEFMRALGVDAVRGDFNEVLPADGERLALMRKAFSASAYTASDAFAFARTNAPSTAIARARLRAASSNVDYAIADLRPTLSASASLNFTDPVWAWGWAVDAAQSIFQGFRKTTAVERSVVAMKSAASAVDEAEQELSKAIEIAVADRDNSVKARDTARTSLREARENLAMVKTQYAIGDVSRIEFTESVSDFVSALGSRVSAFYSEQRAEARLFSLLGTRPLYDEADVKGGR